MNNKLMRKSLSPLLSARTALIQSITVLFWLLSAQAAHAQDLFDKLSPLQIAGSEDIQQNVPSPVADDLSTPGGIVTRFLAFYAFPIAGLILFVMLIWGGFEMLVGATSAKQKDAGKQRVTNALVGFMLLFASYWIAQILQVIFNVNFLGI